MHPVQRLDVNLACVASKTSDYSVLNHNALTASVTVDVPDAESCEESRVLYATLGPSDTVCADSAYLTLCNVVSDDYYDAYSSYSFMDNTCEYSCPCVRSGETCALFVRQENFNAETPSLSICDVTLTEVTVP